MKKNKTIKLLIILSIFFTNLFAIEDSRALYIKKYKNEKKLALVIGNSDYDNKKLSKLTNPINDSRAVRDKLKDRGFEVLYLENGTQREIDKIVKRFKTKLNHSSVGLFYFAGHGIEVKNKNYLIPIGADISDEVDVKYEALAVDEIVDRMKDSNTRLNIVVLDACRNNPFKRGSGGLAPMSNAKGTLIAYATDSGSTASDNSSETNGLFTKHFLKALDEPLNQREFFHKIRMSVYKDSGEQQLPYLNDGTIGDFYFKVDKVKYQNSKDKELIKRVAELERLLNEKEKVVYSKPKKSYNSSDVWIDTDTGYMWQVPIDKKEYNWEEAKRYCRDLNLGGYSDWRLPSKDEFKSILTKDYFPNEHSFSKTTYIKKPLLNSMNMRWQSFWSNSDYIKRDKYAWSVSFRAGYYLFVHTDDDKYVRCMRN